MREIVNIKKIKSPKSSPKKVKNKSYEKFLRGSKEIETNNKDKKLIKVQRKTNSPKKVVKDIRDINDIERKMIQMKDNKNNIKVPTQNTVNNNIKPKPIIENSPKKVSFKDIPKVELKVNNVYNGPQIINSKKKPRKVRISDIDVREKRSEETLTENNKKFIKNSPKKITTQNTNRSSTRNINRSLTRNTNRSSTRNINRSSTRNINLKNRSKKNRKITIQNKKIEEKDIKNVSQKMRIIRNTKTDKIKKELQKQGVKVTGKSDTLLKDIYLYSKICNINIQHEK
jgi:hypothetical protein